jgi:hypothetical protein
MTAPSSGRLSPLGPAREPERSLLERSVRASWVMGALATLLVAVYAGASYAAAYALPLLWMLANFWIWKHSLNEILRPKRRAWALWLVASAKVLWIGVCVSLAVVTNSTHDFGRFLAFLLGFNTPFLVMSLKAVGAMLVERPGTPTGDAAHDTTRNRADEDRSSGG